MIGQTYPDQGVGQDGRDTLFSYRNKKNRRGKTPRGILPRRFTFQRTFQPGWSVLRSVIRQTFFLISEERLSLCTLV